MITPGRSEIQELKKGLVLSQKKTAPLLTLLRLSVGPVRLLDWNKEEFFADEISQRILLKEIHFSEEAATKKTSEERVNLRRGEQAQNTSTPWIWLIDADVIPDTKVIKSMITFLDSAWTTDLGLIGGRYASRSSMSFWEKTYNHLCNIWSETRQTPLAGNLILRREIIQDFLWDQIPFGAEEVALKAHALQKNYSVRVENLPLLHLHQKNFLALTGRCLSQAKASASFADTPATESFPWGRYLSVLSREFPKHPLLTGGAGLYLCANKVMTFFFRAQESLRSILRKTFPRPAHSNRNPRP